MSACLHSPHTSPTASLGLSEECINNGAAKSLPVGLDGVQAGAMLAVHDGRVAQEVDCDLMPPICDVVVNLGLSRVVREEGIRGLAGRA
jgi:hypothetical protein